MSKFKYETREEWMQEAVAEMTPLFETAGYKVPKVRVACGWPSRNGLGKKSRTIGQCWGAQASADGLAQIFISPVLESDKDNAGVLPTLVHEVVHAVVGVEESHNKVFRKCALAVGLAGKMTRTHAGERLMGVIANWNHKLGPYPHAKLNPAESPVKKQTARMHKMECDECGYVARTAQKWIDLYGPAECPGGHGELTIESK